MNHYSIPVLDKFVCKAFICHDEVCIFAGSSCNIDEKRVGRVFLFSMNDNKVIGSITDPDGEILNIALLENVLVTSSLRWGSKYKLWEIKNCSLLFEMRNGSYLDSLIVMPDCKTVIAASHHGIVELFDTDLNNKCVSTMRVSEKSKYEDGSNPVYSLAVIGKKLIAFSTISTIEIWNYEENLQNFIISDFSTRIICLMSLPMEKDVYFLLSLNDIDGIIVWNPLNGERLSTLAESKLNGLVSTSRVVLGSDFIACGFLNKTIKIWNKYSLDLECTYEGYIPYHFTSIDLTNDTILACTENEKEILQIDYLSNPTKKMSTNSVSPKANIGFNLHENIKESSTDEAAIKMIQSLDKMYQRDSPDNYGNLMLHYAIKRKQNILVVFLLLNCESDTNFKNKEGQNSLHIAASVGNIESSKQLLTFAVNINSKTTKMAESVLQIAIDKNHVEYIKWMLENSDLKINDKDRYGRTALHKSVLCRNPEIVQLLIQTKGIDINALNYDGKSALHLCASNGSMECLKLLIKSNELNLNSKSTDGEVPTSIALMNGHGDWAELMLDNGADANSVSSDGASLLHRAAFFNFPKIVKKLVQDLNIDINIRNHYNQTPLYITAMNATSFECCSVLIELGARLDIKNNNGNTILYEVVWANLLKQCEFFLNEGISVNERNLFESTSLHRAMENGSEAMVVLLLKFGADDSLLDINNKTPLDIAIEKNHSNLIGENYQILKSIALQSPSLPKSVLAVKSATENNILSQLSTDTYLNLHIVINNISYNIEIERVPFKNDRIHMGRILLPKTKLGEMNKVIAKIFLQSNEIGNESYRKEKEFYKHVQEKFIENIDKGYQYLMRKICSLEDISFWESGKVNLIIYETGKESLYDWKCRERKVTENTIKTISENLGNCLKFLHSELNCCHNDISPRNVIVLDGLKVKLIDFESWSMIGDPVRLIHSKEYTHPDVIECFLNVHQHKGDIKEIILQAKQSFDIWSYGMCILFLFQEEISPLLPKLWTDLLYSRVKSENPNLDQRFLVLSLVNEKVKNVDAKRLLAKKIFSGGDEVLNSILQSRFFTSEDTKSYLIEKIGELSSKTNKMETEELLGSLCDDKRFILLGKISTLLLPRYLRECFIELWNSSYKSSFGNEWEFIRPDIRGQSCFYGVEVDFIDVSITGKKLSCTFIKDVKQKVVISSSIEKVNIEALQKDSWIKFGGFLDSFFQLDCDCDASNSSNVILTLKSSRIFQVEDLECIVFSCKNVNIPLRFKEKICRGLINEWDVTLLNSVFLNKNLKLKVNDDILSSLIKARKIRNSFAHSASMSLSSNSMELLVKEMQMFCTLNSITTFNQDLRKLIIETSLGLGGKSEPLIELQNVLLETIELVEGV